MRFALSIFYLNIPIAVATMALFYIFLRIKSHHEVELVTRVRQTDWTGIVLLSGAIAGLILGLINGGTVHPWGSAQILAPLITGSIGLLIFVLFETHIAGSHGFAAPFMPMRLFASRAAGSGYAVVFLHDLVLWALHYYFLLYV